MSKTYFEWKGISSPETPLANVAMCVMWRIEYLPWTLACLESQCDCKFSLFIWNNNAYRKDDIESIIAICKPSYRITAVHSDQNVGGIGRFLLLREASVSPSIPLILIDDDQVIYRSFVSEMTKLFRPNQSAGTWAWRFNPGGGYWDRTRCLEGETAHYIGTGGLVCDPKVFLHEDFFSALPSRFSRIEDLWFSFFASQVLGHRLIAAPELVRQVRDGRDQHHSLRSLKTEFLDWLRREKLWMV